MFGAAEYTEKVPVFLSDNIYTTIDCSIRAVVSLESNVKINTNTGESPENAHTIEW